MLPVSGIHNLVDSLHNRNQHERHCSNNIWVEVLANAADSLHRLADLFRGLDLHGFLYPPSKLLPDDLREELFLFFIATVFNEVPNCLQHIIADIPTLIVAHVLADCLDAGRNVLLHQ